MRCCSAWWERHSGTKLDASTPPAPRLRTCAASMFPRIGGAFVSRTQHGCDRIHARNRRFVFATTSLRGCFRCWGGRVPRSTGLDLTMQYTGQECQPGT